MGVFAPTNEAFGELPKAELTYLLANKTALIKVLEYHVASGSVLSTDLSNGFADSWLGRHAGRDWAFHGFRTYQRSLRRAPQSRVDLSACQQDSAHKGARVPRRIGICSQHGSE